MRKNLLRAMLIAFAAPLFVHAQEEKLDLPMIEKFKKEGLQNSKVMEIAFQLTDVSGPRLMNSTGFNRAANYAKKQLSDWKLNNASIEPFGEFGKGWELEKSYAAMTAPYYKPFIAIPKAWTSGTGGLKQAEVILISAKDSMEMEKYRGKLAGKIILMDRNEVYKQSFKPDATRNTEEQLQKLADAKPQERSSGRDTANASRRREQMAAFRVNAALTNQLKAMAARENALGFLSMSPRGHDGTLFVQGGGGYKGTDPENMLDIMLALEEYMPMVRMLKAGIPVKMEVEVKSKFLTADLKGYNVIAEIKGTDKSLRDEVVMLGGHLDSWHGSTGATDNAAGCAIMMEAVRILQETGVKPRRTIRIALWGGEEQGLHGSRNYVKNNFADPATMEVKPAHENLSAYFNLDNGTGKIRGIYLQGNEAARPLFSKWFEPFYEMGAKTVTIDNTGSTDHVAFDAVGLPGFQFIQDDIEYFTRTHHTNMDSYDHLVEEDLKQSAVMMASIIYHATQRDQKLPRKEMQKPATSVRP